jgi:hypothetical protein
MELENTVSYYDTATITAIKSFIVHAKEEGFILLMVVF